VVRLDEENSFVLADLPGLIDGASKGVGLGHDFLRHIERTRVILHIVDTSGSEGRDPVEDFKKINEELALYSDKLVKRPQLVVANKMDLPGAEENYPALEKYVTEKGYPIMKASAATGDGLRTVMYKAFEMLQKAPRDEEMLEVGHLKEVDPDSFEILTDAEDADFEVKGKNIERLVAMTNFDNEEAVYRFQLIWRRLGIEKALKEKGIEEGQSVKIGDMIFEFEDRY
jgi:obg family GTPase cgtA, C-terminal extension